MIMELTSADITCALYDHIIECDNMTQQYPISDCNDEASSKLDVTFQPLDMGPVCGDAKSVS